MLNETMYRIALQYLPNYGNMLIKKLIQECGTATSAFHNSSKFFSKIKRGYRVLSKPYITPGILSLVEQEYQWMTQNEVKLCFFTDKNYPKRLSLCYDAPFMFYYKGAGDFENPKMISIVGTRNASSYGKEVTKKIIRELAPYNVSIVSGLAIGIDTIAHEEALAFHLHTIAVLGSGLKKIYPTSNDLLSKKIVQNGGSIISEYPYTVKPDRQNFPRRNRIIAGMTDATIVAESAQKGGSMITAYIAHSYNRDVYAIPGSLLQDSYRGCHHLIRSNIAAILTSGEELVEMMGWKENNTIKTIQRSLFVELTDEEKMLINILKENNETSLDHLRCQCQHLTPSQIAALLLELEIKGVIECRPGKQYRIL